MKYASGSAFRQALEERLRRHSLEKGVPLARLRKMAAFERLLARLVTQPGTWTLKGGLALQIRIGERARTTQDMDLLLKSAASSEEIHALLGAACRQDLQDWFSFEVARPADETLRFTIRALLDSRPFETFHLDVGMGDPLVEPPENLTFPSLFAFAELAPVIVPAYPISQQIAEKVHACTRPYPGGESSRVKDWVDILLLAQQGALHAVTLRRALEATFQTRATHPLPKTFPALSKTWEKPFQRLAQQTGLPIRSLAEAESALGQFLNPVLQNLFVRDWYPDQWTWK